MTGTMPKKKKASASQLGSMTAQKYAYQVVWSEADQEYLATCLEFPSLSWLDSTAPKALKGMTEIVRGVIADLDAAGETIPEPLATRRYSGKFMVRVSPEIHRSIALKAAQHGYSIQRWVREKLAEA